VKSFDQRVVAITGAGSGIGRALAVDLAGRGAHLALCDVDDTGLAHTAEACRRRGVQVTTGHVDVAERAAVSAWADRVLDEHGRVNVVVNNAGVALGSTVEAMSLADAEWLMNINFWGVVHGTKAFLPHLVASGDGHVVNISSVFGLLPVPTQSAYNASKYAVRGFSEALGMELRLAGAPVGVTTVHPGGIRTNIARNARVDPSVAASTGGDAEAAVRSFERLLRTSPERAAEIILAGVAAGRRRVLVGADAVVIDLLSRLPVRAYQAVVMAAVRHGR